MERDAVTRVYVSSAEGNAQQVYPYAEPYGCRLIGDEAEDVLSRAEFTAVNCEAFESNPDGSWGEQVTNEWGVCPKGGERFSVDRTGWTREEQYAKLVAILEKKAGKTGLTVLVY